MITNNSLLGAVIGTPISQSLSPTIYRAAFASQSLVGEYEAIEANESSIEITLDQ
jgi:shikimate 5-dehydrogenase